MASRTVCKLYQTEEGQMNTVCEKWLKTMLGDSVEKKEDDTMYEQLMKVKDTASLVYVHNECCRKLVDLRKKHFPRRKNQGHQPKLCSIGKKAISFVESPLMSVYLYYFIFILSQLKLQK